MTSVELYREKVGPAATERNDFRDESRPGPYHWRIKQSGMGLVAESTRGFLRRRDMIWNLLFVTGGRISKVGNQKVLRRRSSVDGRWVDWPLHDMTKPEGETDD